MGTVVLAPAGDLGIRDAEQLRDQLTGAMEPGGAVRIDLGEVTAVDTAIVQVLLAAIRSAEHLECSLDVAGALDGPVADYVAAIGLPNPFRSGAAASGL